MANSLLGLSLEAIAQETLITLRQELPLLSNYTTDFSDEVATPHSSVTTRVVTTPSAVDFSASYTAQDAVSTAKTITYNKHKHITHKFDTSELANNGWSLLKNTFMPSVSYGLVSAIQDEVMELVTAANFGNDFAIAASAMDADQVVDLAKSMTANGNPRQDRVMVLSPAHYANLAKDDAIQAAYAFGNSNVIRDNDIGSVHGLKVVEYDTPDNSENLEGFVASKSAILISSRTLQLPENSNVEQVTVTDPDTGYSFTLRSWFEAKEGAVYVSAISLFGVSVGNGNALIRIKSS